MSSDTMSESEEVKFSLRVMINKEKNKVLFAEVDSSFADVLLSFLTLPLGTIVRLLAKHFADQAPIIGSLNTLYQGLANLDSSHFWTDTCKLILVNARNSLAPQCQKLKLKIGDTEVTKYFICENWNCWSVPPKYVAMNRSDLRCNCGKSLNKEIFLKSSRIQTASKDDGAFMKETASFLITDDLEVVPNSAGSCIQILNNLGIRDTKGLEEITVTAGFKLIMDLLKASLLSRTPLTDIFLHKGQMISDTVLSQVKSMLPQSGEGGFHQKKIIVKAIIRKSTNKVLLAQAEEDFVDFLFSLLAIPLGRVVCLLGSNTSLGSVDNLCNSIKNLDVGRYLKTEDLKSVLLKPQLPPEYLSKNQFFSLTEDITSLLPGSHSPSQVHFIDMKGKFSYIKGPRMFMVTDDLVVTPLSAISSISILNSFETPLSDVEEIPFELGMEEALNILKASLTSTSALTDGLKPLLKRQLKQEN